MTYWIEERDGYRTPYKTIEKARAAAYARLVNSISVDRIYIYASRTGQKPAGVMKGIYSRPIRRRICVYDSNNGTTQYQVQQNGKLVR